MITQQINHHGDYEIAHRFALNAMREPNASGVMSQLMRVLANTSINALALKFGHLGESENWFAAKGPVSGRAQRRIRESLNALSGIEQEDVLVPLREAKCVLPLNAIEPVESTQESWYATFDIEGSPATFVAFQENGQVVKGAMRTQLNLLAKTLERTLIMIKHKQTARHHSNETEQRLTRIDIEGLDPIETEFGAFERTAILNGIADVLTESMDELSEVVIVNERSLMTTIPVVSQLYNEQIRLRIAEIIRTYPCPNGYGIDAFVKPCQRDDHTLESIQTQHNMFVPSQPAVSGPSVIKASN